jgi:hypothetical protein
MIQLVRECYLDDGEFDPKTIYLPGFMEMPTAKDHCQRGSDDLMYQRLLMGKLAEGAMCPPPHPKFNKQYC